MRINVEPAVDGGSADGGQLSYIMKQRSVRDAGAEPRRTAEQHAPACIFECQSRLRPGLVPRATSRSYDQVLSDQILFVQRVERLAVLRHDVAAFEFHALGEHLVFGGEVVGDDEALFGSFEALKVTAKAGDFTFD